MEKDGCIICKADLVYQELAESLKCSTCGGTFKANAKCVNGHYICDNCHELEALEYIEKYCLNTKSENPFELVNAIMRHPQIKMHGPEHHFLVPAALITAYYNVIKENDLIDKKLQIAKERAQNVLGGFCGLYGTCGAGVGTGIFLSTILQVTPLSGEEWKWCNLITSESLKEIALHGGPRCCKRDTWIALGVAVQFIDKQLSVKLETSKISCSFHSRNKQCIGNKCLFFPE